MQEIRTLAPDERQQLREMLDALMVPAEEEDKRQALHKVNSTPNPIRLIFHCNK
jgi:hypothetical protein